MAYNEEQQQEALKGINDVKLNKAETNDKSAPVIEQGVSVKKQDRKEILAGINDVKLNKAETNDKSAPVIEQGVHVEKGGRPKSRL